MKLLCVLLMSTAALGQTYQVGRAVPFAYGDESTTISCTGEGAGTAVNCRSYDSTVGHVMYSFTFADGTTRLLEHVIFKRDPLKSIQGPTDVKYRICPSWGIKYVCILDDKGKEGVYMFETRDDDPNRKPKAEYGPAPVRP